MSNHVLVRLEMVFVSVQDRSKVCAKHAMAQKSFWTLQMVLLGDEAQVEARFSPFGDSVSGARFVPNKAWKSFRKHTLELLGDEAQVESCFGPF